MVGLVPTKLIGSARRCLTSLGSLLYRGAMLAPLGRARVPLLVFGVVALVLLVSASVVDAHSTGSLVETSSGEAGLLGPQAGATSTDFMVSILWAPTVFGLLTLLGAACLAQRSRSLAVTLCLLLIVLAGESAVHSAHHLDAPKKAEHCATYSASLHLTGLEATSATPALPQPVPAFDGYLSGERQPFTRVVDGPTSRAPPFLPA